MKKAKETAAILLAAVLFLLLTDTAAWLLMPVRQDFGATWERYLQEERNSLDVLYFGSSIVYCDVIPAAVWEETGLTSYVMAGPEQNIPTSYYYLRQACKTQSPQAVVLELNGLFFPEYPDQSMPNFTYMPWSVNRLLATLLCARPEDRLGLLFPLYTYHDRLLTVTWPEVAAHFHPQPDDLAGYTLLTEPRQTDAYTPREFPTDTAAYRKGMAYLAKIADYCARREIKLVLCLAPIYSQIPAETLAQLEADLGKLPHAAFYRCDEWMDYSRYSQWFDFLHLNLSGADPFSRRLGRELAALGLETAHSGQSGLWRGRAEVLHSLLADQAGVLQ